MLQGQNSVSSLPSTSGLACESKQGMRTEKMALDFWDSER